MNSYEKDCLIANLVGALKLPKKEIAERMVGHFKRADQEWGARIAKGLADACSKA